MLEGGTSFNHALFISNDYWIEYEYSIQSGKDTRCSGLGIWLEGVLGWNLLEVAGSIPTTDRINKEFL